MAEAWSSREQFNKGARQANGHAEEPLVNPLDLAKADTASWHTMAVSPPSFVWGALAARGEVTVLVSQGGGGKTTLMQQLVSVAAADRESFLGFTISPGAGYLMATEDNERSAHYRQRKIDRWIFGHDVCADEPPKRAHALYVAPLAAADVFLWNDEGSTPLALTFEETLATIDGLRIVVIDSASTVYGGNENSRMQVTRFLRWLAGVAGRLDVAVILICHTSKSADGSPERATSGSTAWINSARSAVVLTPQSSSDPPAIQLIKSNLTQAPGPKIELAWNDALGLLERLTDQDWITKRAQSRDLAEVIIALVRARYTPEAPYLIAATAGKSRSIINAVLDRDGRWKRKDIEGAVRAMLQSKPPQLIERKSTRSLAGGLYVAEMVSPRDEDP
jgi:hypothetical protein